MTSINELAELYINGKSLPEIEHITRIPRSTARRKLLRNGVKMRDRFDALRASEKTGKGMLGKKRKFTEEHKEAIRRGSLKRKGVRGWRITSQGYIEYTNGKNKGKMQHRVIMEAAIGREIKFNEHVHHINGNRSDNKIENLIIMSASDHARITAMENFKNRKRNLKGQWS